MMAAEHEQGINPIEYIKNHKCVTDISYLMEILSEKEPISVMQCLWELQDIGVII